LFLAVTVGHVVLISGQVQTDRGVPILEAVTFGTFAEVQRAATGALSSVRRMWSGYLGLRGVKAENDTLRQELAAAQIEIQQQRALADRTRSLSALLELRDRSQLTTVAAEVIAGAATPDFRTLTIDKGRTAGFATDMAVLAPAGVVGRVVVPSRNASKVQLLIDRNAAAGALIERSRAQGIVMGGGDDRLRMEYVAEVADVVVGDLVVTSGIDGIYPKGFVIGQVEAVEKQGVTYKRIVVKPAVDFSSLEEVLVVLTPTPARELEAPGETSQ
jgi:rod shape-determining protein MreC